MLLMAAVALLVALYLYWRYHLFFRDPERTIPPGDNIVAPADGTVVYVRRVQRGIVPISIKKGRAIRLDEIAGAGPFPDADLWTVGIFMHPTGVHVNRAPIDGVVEGVTYRRGQNAPMTLMWLRVLLRRRPYETGCNHVTQNERNTIYLRGVLPVWVVQIADIYVRRIVCRVSPGDRVAKGGRIGGIRMSSQTDLLFPATDQVELAVREGQQVRAGADVIACIRPEGCARRNEAPTAPFGLYAGRHSATIDARLGDTIG